MTLKTEREARLLAVSKRFDAGLARFDLSLWDEVLAPGVILHKDSVTLFDNLHGAKTVKGYFQEYIKRYHYEHSPLAGAVDEHEDVAFSFHVDKGVLPKGATGKTATSTLGMFYHVFDSSDKIKEIYFLRQLQHDEAERKLQHVPDIASMGINPDKYRGSGETPREERAEKHEHVAAIYNQIWATGDPSKADEIFAKDAHLYNLIYGSKQVGVEAFKGMIHGVFKEWDPKEHKTTIAVSAGNKAFNFWKTTGVYKGDWSNVYGLTLLVFNTECKISEVLTFMQPFPSQRRELLKPQLQ
ncbi:hypothetical protein WJX81_005706 [Elliptochloris bilobata]|uniref:SnoaL-like domain-containing protein n=1 Tax=Elliptochloris bilobata TaxID=381761 RepID=A0AAW1RQ92_9CHLO